MSTMKEMMKKVGSKRVDETLNNTDIDIEKKEERSWR